MASTLSPLQIQAELVPQRRFLVLFLPRWATDCLKRADPQLARLGLPIALYEKHKGAMRIAALDAVASNHGLSVGQALSDARAQVPDLVVREIDQAALEASFADFADWHSYASPLVSVLTDAASYGDLVLDITGVSHLFGSEAAMLQRVTGRLKGLGFDVVGAIAPSIGAAWGMAHCHRGAILDGSVTNTIAEFPVAALRLSDEQIANLTQLGLKRIGQLYGRDRKGLQARFGESLLLRLDQALGLIEERMTPRLPLAEHFVEHRFADPIGLMDDVLMCAHDLAVTLSHRLEISGLGAKSFHLFLYRVDHKVMTFSVNAGRPTRDAHHIARLFANRSERLEGDYDAGFGIDMIRLAASSVTPLDAMQVGAFESDNGAQTLDRLYDRVASRLGPLAVLRPKFVNTHIPEQSVKLEPVIAATGDDPLAFSPIAGSQPLRLLPQPELISVALAEVPDGPPPNMIWRRVNYRFIKSSGPERIGAEWWRFDGKRQLLSGAGKSVAINEIPEPRYTEGEISRDYYIAEDNAGRRFWIFREGLFGIAAMPKWYLHGFFA